jgi:SAM-dependent methyltransferase
VSAHLSEPETTNCPACGKATVRRSLSVHDRMCGVPGDFKLIECAACGLWYLNPRPTRAGIEAYYPANYAPYVPSQPGSCAPWRRWSRDYGMRRRSGLVRRYKRTGRLIDVGCASGRFLAEMQRYPGWELAGIEANAQVAGQTGRSLGLPVIAGQLEAAGLPPAAYDVVTLWDVIEHLHEPRATLTEIRRILRPDGLLILRTPSLDSWDARLFGRYWAGLDAPRHLTVYRKASMRRLLSATGFDIQALRGGGAGYFIVQLSLRFWLNDRPAAPRWRSAALALCDNSATRLLSALPLAACDQAGLGSEMLVVARPAHSGEEPAGD